MQYAERDGEMGRWETLQPKNRESRDMILIPLFFEYRIQD
jgi:hypothetical protein